MQMETFQRNYRRSIRFKHQPPKLSITHPCVEYKGYRRYSPLSYSDHRVEPKRPRCFIDIPNYRLRYNQKGVSNQQASEYSANLQLYNLIWDRVDEQAGLLLQTKERLSNAEDNLTWVNMELPHRIGRLITAPETSVKEGEHTDVSPSTDLSHRSVTASDKISDKEGRTAASLAMQEDLIRNLRTDMAKHERLHMEATLQKAKLEVQIIEAQLKTLPPRDIDCVPFQLLAEKSNEELIKELRLVEGPSGSGKGFIEGPSQGSGRRVITSYDFQQDEVFQALKRVDSSTRKGKAVERASIILT